MHTLDPRSRHEVMVVSNYLFGAAYSSEGQEEDYTAATIHIPGSQLCALPRIGNQKSECHSSCPPGNFVVSAQRDKRIANQTSRDHASQVTSAAARVSLVLQQGEPAYETCAPCNHCRHCVTTSPRIRKATSFGKHPRANGEHCQTTHMGLEIGVCHRRDQVAESWGCVTFEEKARSLIVI
jgi:hypothetical protein